MFSKYTFLFGLCSETHTVLYGSSGSLSKDKTKVVISCTSTGVHSNTKVLFEESNGDSFCLIFFNVNIAFVASTLGINADVNYYYVVVINFVALVAVFVTIRYYYCWLMYSTYEYGLDNVFVLVFFHLFPVM